MYVYSTSLFVNQSMILVPTWLIPSFTLQTMCLNLAADGLTKRLRSESFRTILKQDMQFFDKPENSVSALVTDLVVDAQDINQVRLRVTVNI